MDDVPWVPTLHEHHVREQARRQAERNPGGPDYSAIPERRFQADVIDFAQLHGWNVFYVADSRGSPAGWPDLTLARAGVLVSAELKTMRGTVRPAQLTWGADLQAVERTEYRLWRPDCWPEIRAMLGMPDGWEREGYVLQPTFEA